MGCQFVCDNCGVIRNGVRLATTGSYVEPISWDEFFDNEGEQFFFACSDQCKDAICKKHSIDKNEIDLF